MPPRDIGDRVAMDEMKSELVALASHELRARSLRSVAPWAFCSLKNNFLRKEVNYWTSRYRRLTGQSG